MPRTYIVAVLLTLALPTAVLADPGDRAASREPDEPEHEHDYSRFSDGPRRVPTPRGSSLVRARALGLGTREAARALFRGAPSEAIRRAAAWRAEDVDRLLWPVDDGRYVRGFGFVRRTRPDLRHDGVDISAPTGTVVRAVADGIVAYSDNGIRGFGNCVLIVHPNGWMSVYAHNSRTTVQPGWRVRRGERIALVGSTGISRGPHVHFQLHEDGRAVDPLALFDGGPQHVQRVAERAHRAGRVPAPRRVTAADRPTPPALEPWSDGPAPTPVAVTDPASGDDDVEMDGRLGGVPLGSRALLRRLTRFAPTEAMLDGVSGRLFSNLLWPMRGGELVGSGRRGVEARAEEAVAVRAGADGVVAHASDDAILILHRSGWVTRYRGLDEVHVEVGQQVRRGEWIGHAAALRVELRIDGRRVDPREHLVHVPD